MTQDKKDFIEAMLTWFRSPKVGNDEELDRKFLASAYDNITQPHWISVDYELPKEAGYVIVSCADGVGVFKYDKSYSSQEMKNYNYITHWMPFPKKMPVLSNSGNTGRDLKGGEE